MSYKYNKNYADIALGKRKAELVLKQGIIVDVFTNELFVADIAIQEGVIVGVGQYAGEEEIDMSGKYICPGFIDAHLHLESTLLNPSQLIYQAGRKGTTTFIVDPHEAANVAGKDGIDYILEDTKECQANIYVMVPSCVPCLPFECNGAVLNAKDMESYLSEDRILGLGEVMDIPAVLNADEGMLEKLKLFYSKQIDGHGGCFKGQEADCYALAGIKTDHECCTYEDAIKEVRAGMFVLIREGTAAKNLEQIVTGIVKHHTPCNRFGFCTDDKHIEDIKQQGHISYNVQKAIELGISPIEAIKMATLYPATCYELKHLGAIAAGYQADLLVLSNLEKVEVEDVYYKGKRLKEVKREEKKLGNKLTDTVHINYRGKSEFSLPLKEQKAFVLELVPKEILTTGEIKEVDVKDGEFVPNKQFQKIAVFERHHNTGKKGVGIVEGFSIENGAIASTVGHDSHNLIVVGDNDEDMNRAVMELIDCKGGYTVVRSGKEPFTLPLEIMGLMTQKSYEEVEETLRIMIEQAHDMGVPKEIDPFITLSFLALPVIPSYRITPNGMYDVENKMFF
ncbi:adenine deaminase [Velocimicrobium porci]|uniref:Adenine deaminase n=1 Tax=Velocimicrobium porci TaxID=2606634 RepID=A0A6L5XVC3_9FIRM|nr:adenine deaminase [Velocimicrobium porci]MSS62328.1 adenine deaminase [Velocimicrobium porci]